MKRRYEHVGKYMQVVYLNTERTERVILTAFRRYRGRRSGAMGVGKHITTVDLLLALGESRQNVWTVSGRPREFSSVRSAKKFVEIAIAIGEGFAALKDGAK